MFNICVWVCTLLVLANFWNVYPRNIGWVVRACVYVCHESWYMQSCKNDLAYYGCAPCFLLRSEHGLRQHDASWCVAQAVLLTFFSLRGMW